MAQLKNHNKKWPHRLIYDLFIKGSLVLECQNLRVYFLFLFIYYYFFFTESFYFTFYIHKKFFILSESGANNENKMNAAHILYLCIKDILNNLEEHIIKVQKHIKNKHNSHGWLKEKKERSYCLIFNAVQD